MLCIFYYTTIKNHSIVFLYLVMLFRNLVLIMVLFCFGFLWQITFAIIIFFYIFLFVRTYFLYHCEIFQNLFIFDIPEFSIMWLVVDFSVSFDKWLNVNFQYDIFHLSLILENLSPLLQTFLLPLSFSEFWYFYLLYFFSSLYIFQLIFSCYIWINSSPNLLVH